MNKVIDLSLERKKYYKWIKRLSKRLPEFSNRVFSLRKRFYEGCGFHYSLEKQLGSVISIANDYGTLLDLPNMVISSVIVDGFVKSLIKAEKSAEKNTWGWLIERDYVSKRSLGEKSRKGCAGGALVGVDEVIGFKMTKFRLLDDDGFVYYSGVLIDDDYGDSQFEALRFGEVDAGCSIIQVKRDGEWVVELS